MTVEEHAVDGVVGTTTYRFYVNMQNPDDFLSSVYGNVDDPLTISTGGTGFYNDASATGGSAAGINPSFLLPPFDALFPGLPFDSWYTIGIESAPSGAETAVSAVESSAQPWIGAFDATNALSGSDIVIDDNTGGAWYVLNGTPNGLPDAENNRVLFMQLTTSGTPSETVNCQVFENGIGDNDLRFTYSFEGTGTFAPDGDSVPVLGFTDATACNFDETATEDDGSCAFAAEGLDCDGNCLNDADGDGICDENEILGCTNASACNYDMNATDDDESCEFESCAGCTDATACNFDEAATLA